MFAYRPLFHGIMWTLFATFRGSLCFASAKCFRMQELIPLSAVCLRVRVCVRKNNTRGKITPLFACSSSPGATSRKCVFLFLLVIGLSCPAQFLVHGLTPRFVVHLWFSTLLDVTSRRITTLEARRMLGISRFRRRLSYILVRRAAHRFSVNRSGL